MTRSAILATGAVLALLALAPDRAPSAEPARVDATTLRHKVLCGYQGWFRCLGDPANEGWRHWSRSGRSITPGSVTFEMWPDTSELEADEKYPAPGFTNPDGSPAVLFSSANPKTVERHFRWMEQYGVDGVFVQRFLVSLRSPSTDLVLDHVRASAEKTGRVYAIGYDLSGYPADRLVDRLASDWKGLVEERKATGDDRYLRHEGKPVVFVWGFFPDRFGPDVAHQILDLFRADGPHPGFVIGGCPWQWRNTRDAEWARAFRRFGAISPWNVGNATTRDGRKMAATRTWAEDKAEADRAGMLFLPVIYPGFAWTNLKGEGASRTTLPRRRGEFFWEQITTAAGLGLDMAYVAMFDEVDEGTAILKVTPDPPREANFATYEGLPPDAYLRLTGEGTRVIRGEREPGGPPPVGP